MNDRCQVYLEVDIARQQMTLHDAGLLRRTYIISTAANGPGELNGSGCTPRGWHCIRAMIGHGQPVNAVFRGRRPTGEIFTEALRDQFPQRDWILTRILWLSGEEKGKNRLGEVDTMRRYIYIHGAPEDAEFGKPVSHGCVRMKNNDIIELFDMVRPGTRVLIHE